MTELTGGPLTLVPVGNLLGEVPMVGEERWQEIHRLFHQVQLPIAEIARRLDLDRRTVRRSLRQTTWQPYTRPARADTLLGEHAENLRQRAPQLRDSAQILFQELRQHRGYRGSYETVRLFVHPLRAMRLAAERATVRFETPPGLQSQIDWGQARVYFRHRSVALDIFVLTLGRSSTSAGIPASTSTTGPAPCASRPGIARSPGIPP